MRKLILALAVAFAASTVAPAPVYALGDGSFHAKRVAHKQERLIKRAKRLQVRYDAGKVKEKRAMRKAKRILKRATKLGLPVPAEYQNL